jgi:hypothetical protein
MATGREIKAMITLDDDVLDIRCPTVHPHAHAQLEFQRTLRIPDDEKVHALPAGLGCFPLSHIEDFSESLDEATLRRGGIMMPMHRSEAMWINFMGGPRRASGHAYPFAIKVAAGKVNALTGGAWSPALSAEEQDYVVIPTQPWIDGFAISKGIIRQFVAERLGEGFSVEEQLTGKAEFGGLQILAYPMKAERYLDILRAREEVERAREEAARARERRRRIERLREMLTPFSEFSDRARSAATSSMATLSEIEHRIGRAGEVSRTGEVPDPDRILAELRGLVDRWSDQVSELANISPNEFMSPDVMYSMSCASEDEEPSFMRRSTSVEPLRSMGLGGGGRMRQEIYADPYGIDAWDQSAGSRCFVHLVDAAQWAEISGGPAPTEPPSQRDYERRGLPWFDYYAPGNGAVSGSKLLAALKSWGSMYGKGPRAAVAKSGPAIQLGTAQRLPGVVSEGAGDE